MTFKGNEFCGDCGEPMGRCQCSIRAVTTATGKLQRNPNPIFKMQDGPDLQSQIDELRREVEKLKRWMRQ